MYRVDVFLFSFDIKGIMIYFNKKMLSKRLLQITPTEGN